MEVVKLEAQQPTNNLEVTLQQMIQNLRKTIEFYYNKNDNIRRNEVQDIRWSDEY